MLQSGKFANLILAKIGYIL